LNLVASVALCCISSKHFFDFSVVFHCVNCIAHAARSPAFRLCKCGPTQTIDIQLVADCLRQSVVVFYANLFLRFGNNWLGVSILPHRPTILSITLVTQTALFFLPMVVLTATPVIKLLTLSYHGSMIDAFCFCGPDRRLVSLALVHGHQLFLV
jgi:hypothetical protein